MNKSNPKYPFTPEQYHMIDDIVESALKDFRQELKSPYKSGKIEWRWRKNHGWEGWRENIRICWQLQSDKYNGWYLEIPNHDPLFMFDFGDLEVEDLAKQVNEFVKGLAHQISI